MAGITSNRSRIHRSIEVVPVTFPSGSAGSTDVDTTLNTPVNGSRWTITRQSFAMNPAAAYVTAMDLTSPTNLRVTFTKLGSFTAVTEQFRVEAFF